jgi:methylthioribose-1-phosphate isomerase
MPVATIEWIGGAGGHARIIDQTLLPGRLAFIDVKSKEAMWDAIKRLAIRGAPAIGIAGAFGLVLGLQESRAADAASFDADVNRVADYLASSRPTAVNLFWALDRMKERANGVRGEPLARARELLLAEAQAILREDKDICRRLGAVGAPLVPEGRSVLTHCNAGGLATADYGTALAVFFTAKERGKKFRVFVDETRPLLQGSRLTAWELQHEGIDATLICDNMAGVVLAQKDVGAVFVGADRVARNGDAANKIGTYSVSVLAKAHGVPFYVVAPTSTFDLTIADGSKIPIEERDPSEVTDGFGARTAPAGIDVFNPAFDVTPHRNITGIVTEFGLIEAPDAERVPAFFREHVGRKELKSAPPKRG